MSFATYLPQFKEVEASAAYASDVINVLYSLCVICLSFGNTRGNIWYVIGPAATVVRTKPKLE